MVPFKQFRDKFNLRGDSRKSTGRLLRFETLEYLSLFAACSEEYRKEQATAKNDWTNSAITLKTSLTNASDAYRNSVWPEYDVESDSLSTIDQIASYW